MFKNHVQNQQTAGAFCRSSRRLFRRRSARYLPSWRKKTDASRRMPSAPRYRPSIAGRAPTPPKYRSPPVTIGPTYLSIKYTKCYNYKHVRISQTLGFNSLYSMSTTSPNSVRRYPWLLYCPNKGTRLGYVCMTSKYATLSPRSLFENGKIQAAHHSTHRVHFKFSLWRDKSVPIAKTLSLPDIDKGETATVLTNHAPS